MGTYRILLVDDQIPSLAAAEVETIQNVVRNCVVGWKLGDSACDWTLTVSLAKSSASAIDALERASKSDEEFDLLLLDLHLPQSDGGTDAAWENGLHVLDYVAPKKLHTRTIVFSASADSPEPLRERGDAASKERVFDDWIMRAWVFEPHNQWHSAAVAKLKRAAVPSRWIAEQLSKDKDRPLLYRDTCMIRFVHSLYLAAREQQPASEGWPLSRVLLLGDPGTGKSASAEGFRRMLPSCDARAPLTTVNCASLVSEGHGGLIALFGAKDFGGRGKSSQGVFVEATKYNHQYDEPDYNAGGVAFLDEFVEMDRMLQASVLTSVEEGQIRVEGVGGEVRSIGCHIICATNKKRESLIGDRQGSLREDIVDRMFRIIEIPPLSQRQKEVVWLLQSMSARRLRAMGTCVPAEAVMLSVAAERTLEDALRAGLISSFRQLQAVVRTLEVGETVITDGNLDVIFKKAAMLGMGREDISHEAQLRDLGLPPALKWKEMSDDARVAAEKLAGITTITEWSKQPDEVILLLALLERDTRAKYGKQGSCAKAIETVKLRYGLSKQKGDTIAFLTGRWKEGDRRNETEPQEPTRTAAETGE